MMYGWDFNGSNSWWMLAGMLIVAVAIVASVWLIVHRPGAGMASPTPREILRQRFARGEISRDQFDDATKLLG